MVRSSSCRSRSTWVSTNIDAMKPGIGGSQSGSQRGRIPANTGERERSRIRVSPGSANVGEHPRGDELCMTRRGSGVQVPHGPLVSPGQSVAAGLARRSRLWAAAKPAADRVRRGPGPGGTSEASVRDVAARSGPEQFVVGRHTKGRRSRVARRDKILRISRLGRWVNRPGSSSLITRRS
jgi:hypothetical protein